MREKLKAFKSLQVKVLGGTIMNDKYKIDGHKLSLHPECVANWYRGNLTYPICIEISLSGACNHRCIFCSQEYLGYDPNFLKKDVLLQNLKLLRQKGLKSVVLAGEGEPLLHPEIIEIINEIKELGLDIGLVTNGVLLKNDVMQKCINALSWIRISLDAGTKETHRNIHNSKEGDFEMIINNIMSVVELKKALELSVTIGVQMVLLHENMNEATRTAALLKNLGVDYFTIKPYSKHPLSDNKISKEVDYEYILDVEKEVKKFETNEYNIIFRAESMKRIKCEKKYNKCYGIPFWAYIDSKGDIWPCLAYIGVNGYSYGNLYNQNVIDIWEGGIREQIVEEMCVMNLAECRKGCRLDAINEYLYELKNPGSHVNFI